MVCLWESQCLVDILSFTSHVSLWYRQCFFSVFLFKKTRLFSGVPMWVTMSCWWALLCRKMCILWTVEDRLKMVVVYGWNSWLGVLCIAMCIESVFCSCVSVSFMSVCVHICACMCVCVCLCVCVCVCVHVYNIHLCALCINEPVCLSWRNCIFQ